MRIDRAIRESGYEIQPSIAKIISRSLGLKIRISHLADIYMKTLDLTHRSSELRNDLLAVELGRAIVEVNLFIVS